MDIESKNAISQVDKKRTYAFGIVMLLVMVIASSISGYLFLTLQKNEENRLVGTIGNVLSESINRISFSGKYHSRLLLEEMQKRLPELAYISVETLDGTIEAHTDSKRNDKPINAEEKNLSRKCIETRGMILTERLMDGSAIKEVLLPYHTGLDPNISGVVRIGIKVEDARKKQRHTLFIQVFIIIVLTFSAMGIMKAISRHFSKRLTRSEEALRESENRYRSLLEDQTDFVCRFRADGEFTYVNPVYCDFFNKPANELIGKKWHPVPLDEDLEMIQEKLSALSPSNQTVVIENRIRSGKGEIHWMQFVNRGIFDDSGNLMEIQSVGRDITDRKKAEAALLENNELLMLFIRHSPVYCYIKEVGPGRSFVLQASENFEDMIGIKGSGMIGKTMEDLFPPEFAAKITEDDWDVVSKGNMLKLDEELNGKSYTTIKFPIIQGDKTLLAGYTIDITDRKKAEAEKLTAQKIADEHAKQALIGRIAGKMAHDFNNILGIVMGNAELALVDCKETRTRKTLELILNQTIRGKNLTKNLVAFAKDHEPKQEFFSINEKMDLVLSLLKKDLEGINVARQYGRGIPDLLADPGMMEHAIVNLVQNSIHAVSLADQPEIVVSTYHQGEFIFLEIEDNGCGIPPEFLEKIFEPSFTLKGSKDKNGMYKPGIKGTGYGMSNVKRYIEQHKGDISIRSRIQKGTKVILRLPVIKKDLTNDEIKKIETKPICFGKYILIVEDEQAISDVQYRILSHEPCHHKVDIANNGRMAMDFFDRNQYDLISLDYVLPGNVSGMDVYHHLREKNKSVPVLFISGNIEFLESIKELKKNDPYIDHLSKPCKNIDYVNSINKLLGNDPV